MCEILIDAVVLYGVMHVLLGDGAPDFYVVVLVALGLGVVNYLTLFGLTAALGPLGLFVAVPVVVFLDGLILMYFCHLDLRHAGITVGVLLVYKIAFTGLISLL